MTRRIAWLARLPLPLLALSAAWGVYQFQALFVPAGVAALSAVAFEAVYVALAVVPTQDARRATWISVTAVAVSVIYNTLSSLFAIRPALLLDRPLAADIALAVLHGAPLATVAYAVTALLLHTQPVTARATPDMPSVTISDTAVIASDTPDTPSAAPALPAPQSDTPSDAPVTPDAASDAPVTLRQLAAQHGVSVRTIRRRIAAGTLTMEEPSCTT